MIILAIDTATGPCSAAVWKDGRVAAYCENAKPVMQSASLMGLIEDALKQSGTSYQDLTAVACTVGPGSFTGIRVGLAAARAIAFACKIPGLGFTTLDVLAHGAKDGTHPITAVLNAGKGEYYVQYYDAAANAISDAALASPESIGVKDTRVAGNVPLANTNITFPRADLLAALAAAQADALMLTPFYIREPDAKLPSKKA